MLLSYRALLGRAGARPLALGCGLAWLSFAGYALAIILAVHAATGSFAVAGGAVAAFLCGLGLGRPCAGTLDRQARTQQPGLLLPRPRVLHGSADRWLRASAGAAAAFARRRARRHICAAPDSDRPRNLGPGRRPKPCSHRSCPQCRARRHRPAPEPRACRCPGSAALTDRRAHRLSRGRRHRCRTHRPRRTTGEERPQPRAATPTASGACYARAPGCAPSSSATWGSDCGSAPSRWR